MQPAAQNAKARKRGPLAQFQQQQQCPLGEGKNGALLGHLQRQRKAKIDLGKCAKLKKRHSPEQGRRSPEQGRQTSANHGPAQGLSPNKVLGKGRKIQTAVWNGKKWVASLEGQWSFVFLFASFPDVSFDLVGAQCFRFRFFTPVLKENLERLICCPERFICNIFELHPLFIHENSRSGTGSDEKVPFFSNYCISELLFPAQEQLQNGCPSPIQRVLHNAARPPRYKLLYKPSQV